MLVLATLCAAGAWGQRGDTHIGYIYPAGGQQGMTVEIKLGGQNLRAPEAVLVSGEGVSAEIIEWAPPLRGNNRGIVARHLRALIKYRTQQMRAEKGGGEQPDPDELAAKRAELEELPDHPLARGLDEMSLFELVDRSNMLYDPKEQMNSQLAETVFVKVTIAPDAPPGDRELRLQNRWGLSNPMVFQIGLIPEANEREPNDPGPPENPRLDRLREEPERLELPVLVNGQIMPGDVDRFTFVAEEGDELVVQAQARHLVPYLADAVPGWFQATVAIFDAQGRELAYQDEYLFNPDPVLYYEIPAGGEYQLEVRDALYRGREDFVYRVSVGELPFITWVYPPGGEADVPTTASVGGWHLPDDVVTLDTEVPIGRIHEVQWECSTGLCNPVRYMVNDLPECDEGEPNDSAAEARQVVLPQLINGRIDEAGDVDVYSFEGAAGEAIVAEVYGRRLNSPIDSLVRLVDASGNVVELNDDYMPKHGHLHMGPGLLTHYADSYLTAELPADGVYCIEVSDTQNQGGEQWTYRLRLTRPRPDFALRVTPPSLALQGGRSAEVLVYARRMEGFEGPIEVTLADSPQGFTLEGGYVPAGRQCVRMTVTAPGQVPTEGPVALEMLGQARIDGELVTRVAEPAEDQMQAFLWRHLVSADEMLVALKAGRRWMPNFEVVGETPLLIARGATVELPVRITGRVPEGATPHLSLSEPPDGLSLSEVTQSEGAVTLVIEADESALEAGYVDNLIVNVEMAFEREGKDGKTRKWEAPLGVLPAVPFKIVAG